MEKSRQNRLVCALQHKRLIQKLVKSLLNELNKHWVAAAAAAAESKTRRRHNATIRNSSNYLINEWANLPTRSYLPIHHGKNSWNLLVPMIIKYLHNNRTPIKTRQPGANWDVIAAIWTLIFFPVKVTEYELIVWDHYQGIRDVKKLDGVQWHHM